MTTNIFGKAMNVIDDSEIEDMLSKLTPEEIEELNNEVDPDNSFLPPSERCRDQTKKEPTGAFNRQGLLKFLEDEARKEKDWDENTPYEKKTRGKVFQPKVPSQNEISKEAEELGFDTEFDDALKNATEEELVDLAAVLGFTGMLNQVQFNASLENKEQVCGGFHGVAKHEKFKPVPDEKPNDTDIEEVIKNIQSNDAKTTEVNLNNIKNISAEQFTRLCKALADNTNLKDLKCANTRLTNAMAGNFIEALAKNTGLTSLNLESNFLTGDIIVRLVKAVTGDHSGVTHLFLSNQRQKTLGVKAESELANVVKENNRLIRLGVDLATMDARIKIRDHIQTNIDQNTRQKRRA